MPNLTSTLTIALVDDVSGPAHKMAAALKSAEAQAKALASSGLTGRLTDQVSKFGLSAEQIEKVSAAWKQYSTAQGLAANSSNWTKTQASQIKAWENTTVSAIRGVIASEKRLEAERLRSMKSGGGAGSMIGGMAGMMTGAKAFSFAKKSIISAGEMDIATRLQRVYTDVSTEAQRKILTPQAKQIGQETPFSNIDVVKAQTAAMQGLPSGLTGDAKASVAAGMVEHAKYYATLMEVDLKEASESVRTYLQTTGKDISTKEKALQESQKAVNQIVKMAKLGGMSGEDAQQFLKFGAASAKSAGISPEAMMSIGALARRGGLRGEEAGVFMRATASKLVAPTKKGITALNAAGIKYSDYVNMPETLSTDRLQGHFEQEMGTKFTAATRSRLDKILSDPKLIGDRGAFTTAVTDVIGDQFPKTKNGKVSALTRKTIAGSAGGFHKLSAGSVDAERLLDRIMSSDMTLAQLNAFLTDKHGGKGAITQRQREEYNAARGEIGKAGDDPDFAKRKFEEVAAGVGYALENLKGSFQNLQLSLGEANEGLIKWSADLTGSGMDWISNLSTEARQAATALGAITALGGTAFGLKALFGGFGLSTSAGLLDKAAIDLSAAAMRLGGGAPGAAPPAGTPMGKFSSIPYVGTALQLWDLHQQAQEKVKDLPVVPFTFEGWIKQLFGYGGGNGASAGGSPVAPAINTDSIDEAQGKVDKLKKSLLDLGNTNVSPSVTPHIGATDHASLGGTLRGSHSDYSDRFTG